MSLNRLGKRNSLKMKYALLRAQLQVSRPFMEAQENLKQAYESGKKDGENLGVMSGYTQGYKQAMKDFADGFSPVDIAVLAQPPVAPEETSPTPVA